MTDQLEHNKTVVKKFIEAMGCSDGATAATCLNKDAFTLAKGFGKFAGVREYNAIVGTIDAFRTQPGGKQFFESINSAHYAGVREYYAIVGTIDAFKTLLPTGLCPDFKSFTAQGDRVVVEFEGNTTTCNGQPYNNQYCMVFILKEGKISQVNEYFCTKLADDVLWPLVESMSDEIA